ncbi:hypothetical protein GCM10027062_45290 [Nocardioides hungaricus]
MHVQLGGHLTVDVIQNAMKSFAGVGLAQVGDDLAGGDLQGGEQIQGAVALVVVSGSLRGRRQHRQHRDGPVRGLVCGFSSTA